MSKTTLPSRQAPLASINPPRDTGHNVGNVPVATTETSFDIKEIETWVDSIYDPTAVSNDELKAIWDAFSYKGFNREDVLKQLYSIIKDKSVVIQLVIVTALRGPQAASTIKLLNGKSAIDLGIPASGGQGTKVLTLNKIVSATADLAAFYLKKMNAPKRLSMDLPGWLQFPSAGSINMPQHLRQQHIDFSRRFSTLIGGTFQEQIYMQMENNSYLDSRLRLFD